MAKTSEPKKVLVSGAGIAGLALAYWLKRYGFQVTLLEAAPKLRTGGQNVDIRGQAVAVLKKMGIYSKARQLHAVRKPALFLDETGQTLNEVSAESMGTHAGDDIELARGDLVQLLFDATSCECLFQTSLKSITKISAELTNGQMQSFDILVGADGFHSTTRSLAFGEEKQFAVNFGDCFFATCSLETTLPIHKNEFFYSTKNKTLYLYQTHRSAKGIFVFRAPGFTCKGQEVKKQKEFLSKCYADTQWKEMPHLLESMEKSDDFYIDVVEQIQMDRWSKGNVVLVGDAAYCPCLASGQGSGMALIGAYVLAGELFLADGDVDSAFLQYEKEMRPFVQINQKMGRSILEQMIPQSEPDPWMDSSIGDAMQAAANAICLKEYSR